MHLIYGEKGTSTATSPRLCVADAMKYACIALQSRCHMIQHVPRPIGTVQDGHFLGMAMLQHDVAGDPLLVHHGNFKASAAGSSL